MNFPKFFRKSQKNLFIHTSFEYRLVVSVIGGGDPEYWEPGDEHGTKVLVAAGCVWK